MTVNYYNLFYVIIVIVNFFLCLLHKLSTIMGKYVEDLNSLWRRQ
jgi:hypothetical protein